MRKLATVRRVSDIRPIEGADFIELAIVDGWQCVVGKDSFEVGELVIYCEVDSVLPVREEYNYLRKSCYVSKEWLTTSNHEGFRLRTMKLRGQVSQGLLLPLATIKGPALPGDDVSDSLGIVKWDPPLPVELLGKAKGRYPSYIPNTSLERIQNLVGEVFPLAADVLWESTLKLDGTSCTFYRYKGEVGVCSHTVDLLLDQEGNHLVNTFHRLDMGTKLRTLSYCGSDGNIAIQGELVGPAIHGNREDLKQHEFYAYNIWDIDTQSYLHPTVRDILLDQIGLQTVPIIDTGRTLEYLGCDTLEGMLAYADRPSIKHKVAEGVVFKRLTHNVPLGYPRPTEVYHRRSFKCINNRYLLGEK